MITEGQLTGRVRGRISLWGIVIMQVELYTLKSYYRYPHPPKFRVYTSEDYIEVWRDATKEDICQGVIFSSFKMSN